MTDWATTAWLWATDRPAYVITAWALAALVAAVVLARAAAALRGRTVEARAGLGFAAVQAGLAYTTITGVYDFWHHRVAMPTVEAWLISGFIEACVWAAVGMVYLHGRSLEPDTGRPTVGFGDAAGFFWMAAVGGSILAVIGSPTVAVALGRTVVCALGCGMWYLKLLRMTRRTTAASRWRITPHRLMLQWGWKTAAAGDLAEDSQDWQVARLVRAMRLKNDGGRIGRYRGKRALTRYADAADPAVLLEARRRYAFGYVLRTEVAPDSETMAPVIADARRSLTPPAEVTACPVPEPDPAGQPDPPADDPPVTQQHPLPDPPVVATAPPTDYRRTAEVWAYDELRAGRTPAPTAKVVGVRFGRGEEWGRQRLNAARDRLARERAAADAPHGEGVPAASTAG